jgi:hypothetical protein
MHTTAYYSVLKRKGILSFVTIWMNLEDIMLSEIDEHRRTNIEFHYLDDESS